MIQLQTMRLSSLNALAVSSNINFLLTHEEAECGAVTSDDLGKFISPQARRKRETPCFNEGAFLYKLPLLNHALY